MSEAAESVATESTFQTFDSFEDAEVSAPDAEGWGAEEAEVKESKPKDEGLKVLKDTDVDLDGKVVKEEGRKEKKEAKEEKFDDEGEIEEEVPLEDQPINESTEKKESKKIRMRMGDGELYNIDSDSSFKVKVDGELVEVPVQELLNNYAGKTAWDKKFTELGKEKKAVEFEKSAITKQKDILLGHLNQALGPIKDLSKNPLDSLLYLVEMSGEDPYTAYRRILEANIDEVETLMDMGETERELYFHKKKDELHSNVAKKRQERTNKDQVFNQTVQKIDALRQTYNVTEDAFVDASEELEEIYTSSGLDANSITEETVVDYASLKPHIVSVRELVEPYEDNISEKKYGDVVAELARYLRDGKADKASIQELLKRNYSVDDDVKDLNTKVYQKGQKGPRKVDIREKDSDGSESFDDFDV